MSRQNGLVGGARSPLVSVVTPAFNAASYIRTAIDSVRSQDCEDWEHLVIDDSSSDATRTIVEAIARDEPRVRCIPADTHGGPGAARNRGIAEARGRYIAFLDADDWWYPQKLQRQIAFMQQRRASFSFTPYHVSSGAGGVVRVVDAGAPVLVGYPDMLRKRATMGCSTVVVEAGLIQGERFPELARAQDYGLWLKLLRSGAQAARYSEPLGCYRLHPGGISRNKPLKVAYQWLVYRRLLRLPVYQAAYYMACYAKNAVFRP